MGVPGRAQIRALRINRLPTEWSFDDRMVLISFETGFEVNRDPRIVGHRVGRFVTPVETPRSTVNGARFDGSVTSR